MPLYPHDLQKKPVILFGDHTRLRKYLDKPFAVGAEGGKILKLSAHNFSKSYFYLFRSLQIPSRGYSRHFQFLKKFHLPTTSIDQQEQIVAEIEKQFSRLDEAVAGLKRAKANLKRYKAAILKAAVEGRLTEQWRQGHPDVEPAEKLLQRILAERRAKWELGELAKMKTKGKESRNQDLRKKYQEPVPAASVKFDMPKCWTLGTTKQLFQKVQYGTSSKADRESKGIPVLRMGNIVDGELLFNKLKYLPEDHSEFPELLLESGDLLFNRTNSPELVGKPSIS